MNALRPYYRDEKMRLCPTATRVVENNADWGTFKAWYRELPNRYPAAGEGVTKNFIGSYSINNWTNYMVADRGARKKERVVLEEYRQHPQSQRGPPVRRQHLA